MPRQIFDATWLRAQSRRLVLAITVLTLGAASCASPPEPASPPLLLLGIDGLEWDVVLPLVESGDLPVIAGLLQRGTAGKLATLSPTLSPVIWTTVATGKMPAKHGIQHFVTKGDEDEPRRAHVSTDRRTKAI
jgi:predicted AlkP superfamily pyrophosphatase or phosphodiesterase